MRPDDKKVFSLELIAASLFIGSIILSVYLSYLVKTNRESSFTKKANVYNSIVAFTAVSLFTIISFYNYQKAKEKGVYLTPYTKRLLAETFASIGFLINIQAAILASK